ncbi:hypothetical protein ACS5PU_13155 [Pedobacter sp. GSP4]|uniref:hypothetical protein n=1 Tax=Pedobacter sp. GSP4 TaxID=3453716 RepID=UPI003EED4C8D
MEHIISNWLMPILSLFGFLITYYFIKNMLPSYFNEKGKNLATKDDIKSITTLVEEVKITFAAQTEKLKANLNVLTSIQLGIANEERNAIILLNQSFFKWYNIISSISLGGADESSSDEIREFQRKRNMAYDEFSDSDVKFKLFVEDPELINKFYNLKSEVLHEMGSYLREYTYGLLKLNIDLELSDKVLADDEKRKIVDRNYEQRDFLRKETSDRMIEAHRKLHPLINDFQLCCRLYMTKLIEEK